MRRALGNLSAAYMFAAGVFGSALLLTPGAGSADEPEVSTALSWYDRLEMRLNPPPDSVTLTIGPWSVPLRRLKDDPASPPAEPPAIYPPEPQAIPPETPLVPLITRFAELVESLAPVLIAPPEPPVIPLDNSIPSLDAQLAKVQRLEPVRVLPEPGAGRKGRRVAHAAPEASKVVSATRAVPELRPSRSIVTSLVPGIGKSSPITHVADRLRTRLPRDLYANFDLFLYVSKSTEGPLAQRMYVFAKSRSKSRNEELTLLHDWPVSTGRETMEVDNNGVLTSTATPVGYYQFDPKRFYRKYSSSQWGKPMPNSMFFNWVVRGYQTGLAIHGVSDMDEVAALGTRASAGCVHLSPEASEALFNLVLHDYRGLVPRFAYDSQTQTASNNGKLSQGDNGAPRMVQGYKALVVIENYGGQDQLSERDMDLPGSEG
jgi:hypothetical protein